MKTCILWDERAFHGNNFRRENFGDLCILCSQRDKGYVVNYWSSFVFFILRMLLFHEVFFVNFFLVRRRVETFFF